MGGRNLELLTDELDDLLDRAEALAEQIRQTEVVPEVGRPQLRLIRGGLLGRFDVDP